MGKGKRVDVYLEVRKRRGHIFLNETSACGSGFQWYRTYERVRDFRITFALYVKKIFIS
jgi:hypothetical protein